MISVWPFVGEGLASRGLSFHVPELGLLVLGVCSIYAARSLSDPFDGFHPAPFQRRDHSGRIAELNRTLPVTGRPAVPNRARFAKNMLRGGSPKDFHAPATARQVRKRCPSTSAAQHLSDSGPRFNRIRVVAEESTTIAIKLRCTM